MDFAQQVEEKLDSARESLIEATQASIEADSRLKAAKTAVARWENVLKALSDPISVAEEPPRAEPPPQKPVRPLEERSPEADDAPAPPSSGPPCKSCGAHGTTRLITRRINEKPIRMFHCTKCKSESPAG